MISLKDLTKEQIEELQAQMKLKEAEEQEKRKQDIEAYKDLVDETVSSVFCGLAEVSEFLAKNKELAENQLNKIIEVKNELYGAKEEQQTHTFTTKDGKMSVCIGYRIANDYDETLGNGIAKVHEFISSLAVNDETARLVNIIGSLLRTDKNGNMKPSRVLELSKLAMDINDQGFTEGVKIIQAAYKPRRTRTFITAWLNLENGGKQYLNLSMSNPNE